MAPRVFGIGLGFGEEEKMACFDGKKCTKRVHGDVTEGRIV